MGTSFLEEVCQALANARVPYCVVGGYAVALHGAVRGTVDVDIGLKWSATALSKTEKVLTGLGLQSRLPVSAEEVFSFREEYVNNRNLLAWNFFDPTDHTRQVDVLINFDLSGKRIKRVRLADSSIRILALADLIEMKKTSARPQDLEDVRALEQLR